MTTRHLRRRTVVYSVLIGGNACTRRSLKNGRSMAISPVTETNLNLLPLWRKDFVQGAGRALLPKALKSLKLDAILDIRLRTILLTCTPTWETKIRLSNGSILLIRNAIPTYWA